MTTTSKVSISEKVKEYVNDVASIPPGMELKNNTLIFDEGLFDSMGFMSLINFIDEEFGVQPDDDELVVENFESVDAIVKYLSKKLSV